MSEAQIENQELEVQASEVEQGDQENEPSLELNGEIIDTSEGECPRKDLQGDKEQGGEPEAQDKEYQDKGDEQKSAEVISELERELEREKRARLAFEAQLLCTSLLEGEGLPRELAEYLNADTPDEAERIIKGISQVIKQAINDGIKSRLATLSTPIRSKNEMTRAEFKSLSLAQRQELYRLDKDLYKQLTNNN